MVETLEEHLELSLAERTLSLSWRYLEVNCGSCSLFPRDVKHTHFDFFGGGTLAGGDLILITLPSPSEFPLYLPSPTEVDGILTTGDFESPGT